MSRAADRSYLTPRTRAEFELREKGSRFRAILLPVATEAEARERLESVRSQFPEATHHCWAYRVGWPARERSADAGEPSGTAGAPILSALAGRELSNVLVVVVRWFGGTKLGRGGLVRAYGGATREVVELALLVERFPTVTLSIELTYGQLGAVKRRLRPPDVEIESQSFGERVRLVLRVADRSLDAVEGALADLGVGVLGQSDLEA